jgi:hypothetical protein
MEQLLQQHVQPPGIACSNQTLKLETVLLGDAGCSCAQQEQYVCSLPMLGLVAARSGCAALLRRVPATTALCTRGDVSGSQHSFGLSFSLTSISSIASVRAIVKLADPHPAAATADRSALTRPAVEHYELEADRRRDT